MTWLPPTCHAEEDGCRSRGNLACSCKTVLLPRAWPYRPRAWLRPWLVCVSRLRTMNHSYEVGQRIGEWPIPASWPAVANVRDEVQRSKHSLTHCQPARQPAPGKRVIRTRHPSMSSGGFEFGWRGCCRLVIGIRGRVGASPQSLVWGTAWCTGAKMRGGTQSF